MTISVYYSSMNIVLRLFAIISVHSFTRLIFVMAMQCVYCKGKIE